MPISTLNKYCQENLIKNSADRFPYNLKYNISNNSNIWYFLQGIKYEEKQYKLNSCGYEREDLKVYII